MMQTIHEVRKYLCGDTITCLLCGQSFLSLGTHIAKSHNITARQYRVDFGIPMTYALEVASVRDKRAKGMSKKQLDALDKHRFTTGVTSSFHTIVPAVRRLRQEQGRRAGFDNRKLTEETP